MPTTYENLPSHIRDMKTEHARSFAEAGNTYTGAEVRVWVHDMADLIDGLRASLAPSPAAGGANRVYLVATGHAPDGRELYERHDAPVPMCDYEVLYTAPPAPSQPVPATETALERFNDNGATDGLSPLERLRFFCCLAMNGQDWLDVEPFFDALSQPVPVQAVPQVAEPVATLHDDGCFTWKRDEFRLKFDRQRAGWRMDVYATPQAAPVAWSEADAVALAHRAGFAGTSWSMGPEELAHLLNLAAAPVAQAERGWQPRALMAEQVLREIAEHVSQSGDHTPESFRRGMVSLMEPTHKILRAAAVAPVAQAERAGWVLVPVEPTEDMENAAMHATTACSEDYHDEGARQEFRVAYRAAVFAAPTPDHKG